MTPLLKLGFCPPIDQPREKKELAEQIIPYAASVEVEVEVGRGKTVAESVKKIGVTERLTRCSRPRCSSNGGGTTPARSGRTVPWDTLHG